MKQADDSNGHFLFALVLLPLGVWQLFVPEGRMYGIVAVAVALLWLAFAILRKRRFNKRNDKT